MIDLLQLIVVLAVFGVVWWLLTTQIPLPQPVRTLITVLMVVFVCVFLLNWVGVLGAPLMGHRLR